MTMSISRRIMERLGGVRVDAFLASMTAVDDDTTVRMHNLVGNITTTPVSVGVTGGRLITTFSNASTFPGALGLVTCNALAASQALIAVWGR